MQSNAGFRNIGWLILVEVLLVAGRGFCGQTQPEQRTNSETMPGETETALRQTLAVHESTLGPYHLDVSEILEKLAVLCTTRRCEVDAIPLARRALAIREQILGPEHLQVARSLNTLATLCSQKGWYSQAEPMYHRALRMMDKSLGSWHPDLVPILNNLAVFYGTQRRYTSAEVMLRRALLIREKLGDSGKSAAALRNLANLYRISGQYAKAEPLLRQWLEIRERAMAPNGRELADGLLEHGFVLRKMHRKSEAKASEARARSILGFDK